MFFRRYNQITQFCDCIQFYVTELQMNCCSGGIVNYLNGDIQELFNFQLFDLSEFLCCGIVEFRSSLIAEFRSSAIIEFRLVFYNNQVPSSNIVKNK